jgi:protein-tyrosine phosphatase
MSQPSLRRWPARSEPSPDNRFHVLVVCRANHCRSPMMEFLLRQQIELRNLNWTVSSAGTEALPGLSMHPYSAEILLANGYLRVADAQRGREIKEWVSRRLDVSVLEDADLVLTATQDQRLLVESLDSNLIGLAFPLLQFAHMARSAHSARKLAAAELAPWLIQESYRRRKRVSNFPEDQRDLDDPIGRTMNRFRHCAQLIMGAYADILACGPPARRS